MLSGTAPRNFIWEIPKHSLLISAAVVTFVYSCACLSVPSLRRSIGLGESIEVGELWYEFLKNGSSAYMFTSSLNTIKELVEEKRAGISKDIIQKIKSTARRIAPKSSCDAPVGALARNLHYCCEARREMSEQFYR